MHLPRKIQETGFSTLSRHYDTLSVPAPTFVSPVAKGFESYTSVPVSLPTLKRQTWKLVVQRGVESRIAASVLHGLLENNKKKHVTDPGTVIDFMQAVLGDVVTN